MQKAPQEPFRTTVNVVVAPTVVTDRDPQACTGCDASQPCRDSRLHAGLRLPGVGGHADAARVAHSSDVASLIAIEQRRQ